MGSLHMGLITSPGYRGWDTATDSARGVIPGGNSHRHCHPCRVHIGPRVVMGLWVAAWSWCEGSGMLLCVWLWVCLDSPWQMNLVAGCFYDGMLLYAMVLNETLREGGSKKNATHIIEKMRDRKFQGNAGMSAAGLWVPWGWWNSMPIPPAS